MARIRTIKPEFFVSAQVADVSPTTRLLFVGMWLFCDDAGIHPASARQLKMEVFPGDDITSSEVQDMVNDLLRVGLLVEYSVAVDSQTQTYWQVTGWHHQKIDKPRCYYPQPDSTSIRRVFDDTSETPRSLRLPETTVPETTEGITSTSRRQNEYSDNFEAWWQHYPRKVQKLAAAKAYRSACQRANADVILQATMAFAGTPKATGDFCPYPATWLNESRWEDDPKEWQRSGSCGGNGRTKEDVVGKLLHRSKPDVDSQ